MRSPVDSRTEATPLAKPVQRRKLLIFVIAYYAESTLRRVLERIPSSIFERYDCEVLVVDDGSEDRTFAIGREYMEHHPEIRMTVLRNEYNQGYGGNQKVGYKYAIRGGRHFGNTPRGGSVRAPKASPPHTALVALNAGGAVWQPDDAA